MTNLIILTIALLINSAIFVYLFIRFNENRDLVEEVRLREFTKAVKSKNVEEYTESINDEEPELPKEPDELLEINDDSIPEKTLIKALKRSQDDNIED